MDRNVINLYLKFLSVNSINTTGNAKTRSIARRGSGASIVNISLSISRRKKQFSVHVQPTELHNITCKKIKYIRTAFVMKKNCKSTLFITIFEHFSLFFPITGPRQQKKKIKVFLNSK